MVEHQLMFEVGTASVDAIQRAAYRMSDRLAIDLSTSGDEIRCALHIGSDDPNEVEVTLSEFRNRVLDEVLRERIREETADVRNLILSLAFSQTGLASRG